MRGWGGAWRPARWPGIGLVRRWPYSRPAVTRTATFIHSGTCLSEWLLCSLLQTIHALKGRVSELQWSLQDQEMQLKRLESEKQELAEQLELRHR